MTMSSLYLAFFGWATILNFAVLLLWFLCLWLGHDWFFGVQRKFINVSESHFDALNYGGIGLYKILIILFFATPYLALRIAS